jgi:uncharacterized protein (DUF1697 family)
MSYCFDVLARTWTLLEEQLPADVRAKESTMRFAFLLEEIHEANHRLKDAINHDERVSRMARKLDEVLTQERKGHGTT